MSYNNNNNSNSTENEKYNIERLYNTWLVDSIVFLSFSFIFMDSIKAKSILISKFVSNLIAISLFTINIIFTITAFTNYFINTNKLINKDKFSTQETISRNLYIVIGIIYIFIQFYLIYVLIKNTFFKK